MSPLLSVDQAIQTILSLIQPLPVETVHLTEALNRILSSSITSGVDLPPFASSSMDGYAVRSADVNTVPVQLKVTQDIPAGVFSEQSVEAGEAARIMTGAPVPAGADAIIPVEDTDSLWSPGDPPPSTVTVKIGANTGANVRPIGENVRQGQVLLTPGMALRPQDIGILAAVGQARIPVARQPRVVILTNGDELLTVDQPLSPGKIYDSNSYTLAGLVTQTGGIPVVLPIGSDTFPAVRTLFQQALDLAPDMIISSAGVSVGAADFVKTVLEELGQVNFWRINIRPGKPLAFGMLHQGNVPFFGLPGNPVSAMVTFDVCVRPALFKMMGRVDQPETATAITEESFTSDGRRSYLRVILRRDGGRLLAKLTGTQSSGALFSMVLAEGLLIVPEGVTQVNAGDEFTVRLLR